MARREFHFEEGSSKKFWAIEVAGKSFTVQFGRLGTAGQSQTKDFTSAADAKKAVDTLIAEKVKKGYLETGVEKPAPSRDAGPSSKAVRNCKPDSKRLGVLA